MKTAKYNETEIVKLMFGILTYHQIPVRHLLCLNHPMNKNASRTPPPHPTPPMTWMERKKKH